MITTMDVDNPQDDQRWDSRERGETEVQRRDRNWNSLLQELRVVQSGVQLLTGFLLTLPFQQRFGVLDRPMRYVYLVTVGLSVGATVLLVAPVSIHRLLFRHRRTGAGVGRPPLRLRRTRPARRGADRGSPPSFSPRYPAAARAS